MNRARQNGFTLVELVVVIVLLGVLAATALPRFLNVNTQAHDSVVQGVLGGLQTGASMYHAQWMAEGQPAANTAVTAFNSLRTNASGFPYGNADNSGGTSNVTTSADCAAIFNGVLQSGAPTVGTAASAAAVVGATNKFTAVATAPNCTYFYTGEKSTSGASIQTLVYASATGTVTKSTATLP